MPTTDNPSNHIPAPRRTLRWANDWPPSGFPRFSAPCDQAAHSPAPSFLSFQPTTASSAPRRAHHQDEREGSGPGPLASRPTCARPPHPRRHSWPPRRSPPHSNHCLLAYGTPPCSQPSLQSHPQTTRPSFLRPPALNFLLLLLTPAIALQPARHSLQNLSTSCAFAEVRQTHYAPHFSHFPEVPTSFNTRPQLSQPHLQHPKPRLVGRGDRGSTSISLSHHRSAPPAQISIKLHPDPARSRMSVRHPSASPIRPPSDLRWLSVPLGHRFTSPRVLRTSCQDQHLAPNVMR